MHYLKITILVTSFLRYQNFVKENLISHKYGKILRDAFKNRMDGDYVPYIEFSKEIYCHSISISFNFQSIEESFLYIPRYKYIYLLSQLMNS